MRDPRHDGIDEARRLLSEGIESLSRCLELLRGPSVPASDASMRAETTVTRAHEALRSVRLPEDV